VGLDFWLWLLSAAGEASVLALLLYRRTWRTLPFFCAYCLWALLSDCGEYAVLNERPSSYLTVYFITNVVDAALQFCVLVELAWSVFRPFRASLPRQTFWVLGFLIAGAGALILPFAASTAFAQMSREWQMFGRVDLTVTILRILVFLVLAGCSQLLSIGWRDRELQIATGLGFYSLVAVAVSALHSHMGPHPQHYHQLNQMLVASYVASLAYWVFSFAQKEAERREFSPQMQGLLLAVAGAARSSRIAVTSSSSRKSRTGRDL
jgi:hypothetical protein